MTWQGESRRHSIAAKKAWKKRIERSRASKRIVGVVIRRTPIIGDTINTVEDVREIVKNTRKIIRTYKK